MSDQAIVAIVLAVFGFIAWLSHTSYRVGRIYSMIRAGLLTHREVINRHERVVTAHGRAIDNHDQQLRDHERRLGSIEGRPARPAAS